MLSRCDRRPDISLGILVVGAIAYVFLCLPAISQRGYPPIHPFWLDVTTMWFLPVCLSALFDSCAFTSRRYHLLAYSLFTAFFDAGTQHYMTPRHMTPVVMLVSTILYHGPLHLAGTALLELVMQLILSRCRSLNDSHSPQRGLPRITLSTWIVGNVVICVGIGSLFVQGARHIRNKGEESPANDVGTSAFIPPTTINGANDNSGDGGDEAD